MPPRFQGSVLAHSGLTHLQPTAGAFLGIPQRTQKTAKQTFGFKANEYVNEFGFGKPPITTQNDLGVARKHGAAI